MSVASKQGFPASQKDFNVFQRYFPEVSTGVTPAVFDTYSIPANTASIIKIIFIARITGVNQAIAYSGEKIWMVSRGTGNAIRINAVDGDGFEDENYTGASPRMRVIVNSQDLDFQLTGKAATNINWQITIQIQENINNG